MPAVTKTKSYSPPAAASGRHGRAGDPDTPGRPKISRARTRPAGRPSVGGAVTREDRRQIADPACVADRKQETCPKRSRTCTSPKSAHAEHRARLSPVGRSSASQRPDSCKPAKPSRQRRIQRCCCTRGGAARFHSRAWPLHRRTGNHVWAVTGVGDRHQHSRSPQVGGTQLAGDRPDSAGAVRNAQKRSGPP
jgi:hypothetical protein